MRIGVNVPDDLLKQMEPINHMTNLSQVCREAIKDRVDAYERARARADREGMQEVAARLWQEYSEQAVGWETVGYEDAKMWVQLASVTDFEHLFHNLKIDKRQGRSPRILVSRHLSGAKTFLDWQYEHKEWFDRQSELDDSTNHAQQAESDYTRGWLSYVTAVWQIVMGRMTEGAKIQEEGLSGGP